MSRKRKRKGKRKKKSKCLSYSINEFHSTDRHHLLWQRKKWSKNACSNLLRTHPYFIVDINKGVHRQIHEVIRNIPVPSEQCCIEAYNNICHYCKNGSIKSNDPTTFRLDLLINMMYPVDGPTVHALRIQRDLFKKILSNT